MKIILIGPPGVGKGTQSSLLQKKYGFEALSSGEILRQEVLSKSELGKYTKTFLDSGQLLPDDVIVKIMIEHLHKMGTKQNAILFDGFPRTVGQAKELDNKLKEEDINIDLVIIFDAPSQVILERLGGRLSCPACGSIYHLKNHPPIVFGACDQCKTSLITRTDDQEEAIVKRLELFNSLTFPLIEYYNSQGKAYKVNAKLSSQEIFDSVCQIIDTSK